MRARRSVSRAHDSVVMVRVGGAPRRAAARRCAYHTEQKSLERTFEGIDPATIAEVLASHSGNMEAAAMDLVEMDRAGFRGNSGSSSPADKTSADADDHKKSAAETSFWNDVLGDVTVDEEEEEESEAAIETDARAFFAAVDGATPYASWPADQWAAVEVNVLGTLTEDLNQGEKLAGWRPAPPTLPTRMMRTPSSSS